MTIPQGAQDITTSSGVASVMERLAGRTEVSVDVEADAMHAFRARLCWLQLGTDDDVFLLDTLLPEVRPDALASVFSNPAQTKFFHAAGGDLQYLAEAGVRVKGLFDTHRAATLLGWPKVGLADLVLEKLGQQLKKEHQQSDFSVRPLPPELRAYIADDVRYLTDVGRMVREACVAADILEEVLLDCDRMCDDASQRPDASSHRISLATNGMSAEQVLVGHALIKWLHELRLTLAEQEDIPMGRMLSNTAIAGIAAKPPSSLNELKRIQGVRGAFLREQGERVLEQVRLFTEQGKRGELPPAPEKARKDPKTRKREEALSSWRKDAAVKRKSTPSAVLSNPLVEDLARLNPTTLEQLAQVPYFGAKRVSLYGPTLLSLLKSTQ